MSLGCVGCRFHPNVDKTYRMSLQRGIPLVERGKGVVGAAVYCVIGVGQWPSMPS